MSINQFHWPLESCMTLSISNLTVDNMAPSGTVVGLLTAQDASGTVISCNFTLTKNSAGVFAISGNNLVTAFGRPISAGVYSVRIHANGISTRFAANAVFNVRVSNTAPPPPPQPVITVTPSTPTVRDTTPLGAVVAAFSVVMSDGSPFTGTVGPG